jgi:indole-3-glycerol phosphate synthase
MIMKRPALEEIIVAKRNRLAQRKASTPLDAMRALAGMQKRPQPILSTVTDDGHVMLFGQIRYGTPSYDPVTLALHYAHAGLDGITLFTDNRIYEGGITDLALVTRAVPMPVLMQNYVFDEYQVVEARAAGASSLTLVAELVDASTLRTLISATQRNRMTAIVRVQNQAEMDTTLEVCPPVIEVGKRDDDGTLDLAHIERLRAEIPSTCRVLFFNRLRNLDEAKAVAALKPNAVLVSPGLLTQENAVPQLREIFAH